tara:strand:+ start:194 stop:781 length:588 start_codon:yes stop_codon:yes gene_type:complete
MPLNLDSISDGSSGGQFYDKLRFNAQGGVWFMKSQDGEKRFPSGFKAVFDMENLQTGWSKYNGTYVDFIADPSLEDAAPKPAESADDEDKWKRSFKLLAYSKDAFGGTLEFMHSARTVIGAFTALHSHYESKAEAGKLPVVSVDGDPAKVGDYYGPAWEIVKMVDRPAEMGAMREEEEAPAAAPASEDVPTDDEF